MITVEKAESYRCCNHCNSNINVWNITIRYKGTNSGTQIALCNKCIRDLTEKLNTQVYATSVDGYTWKYHPTKGDIVDKINELIECLNTVLEREDE